MIVGSAENWNITPSAHQRRLLQEMSEYLLPGKTAVITEIGEDWLAPIETRDDLVRFALATNPGSVNGKLAGGLVMSLRTWRDSGIYRDSDS